MIKVNVNVFIGLLAIALFAHAQYEGWNLFERDAGAPSTRSGSSRTYHK
jgi:hypothetical protein